jgi:hypothetical protein
MGLNTNFTNAPYFDDYNEDKNFHRVLFKPAVAVQARELTQLQTILQNQIERFGDNILKEGTIVKGCNFNYIDRFPYVKIKDLQTDGQPVVMSNYKNLKAVGVLTGVEALVIDISTGLESAGLSTGILNTLFLRYVKSGSNGEKVFSSTENIRLEGFSNYRSDITNAQVVTTVTAAGEVPGQSTDAIGNGVGLKVSDGIVYQKGNFIRVDEQTLVVEKYSIIPDGIVVGFATEETIINSTIDSSLLDNAEGYNNESAPGADRVKLTPLLTVKTLAEAKADETFFALVEYQNGFPARRKQTTEYSTLGRELARRTFEESGNYYLDRFHMSIEENANSSLLDVRVGAGKAYVDGQRVETFGSVDVAIRADDTDFKVSNDQVVTINLGNYYIVDEVQGNFPYGSITKVKLYNTAQAAATANTLGSVTGAEIGSAQVRGIQYNSGSAGSPDCQYRLYVFDVRISNTNHTPSDVRSVVFNDDGGNFEGAADIVLANSLPKIYEENLKRSFYNIGQSAIKTVSDLVYIEGATQTAAISTDTVTISSVSLDYSDSTLSDAVKRRDIIVVHETSGDIVNTDDLTITISGTGTTMTITGFSALSLTGNVRVYYKRKRDVAAGTKESRTVFIKIDASSNPGGTTGQYSLGLPDVYKIEAVYKDTGTVTESSPEVTDLFTLFPNQRDAYYGLSYVKSKPALTVGGTDLLLFKVKVFETSHTGYFDLTSYISLPTSSIDYQDIPVYTSEFNVQYDLRNVIDFRPYADKDSGVGYNTTAASASTATVAITDVPNFTDTDYYPPSPGENVDLDYSYFLPRIDRITLDGDGSFAILEGVAQEKPTPPSKPSRGISLGLIRVPAYPPLTSAQANASKKFNYAVRIDPDRLAKGYDMATINKMDRRLKNIEYYTVLNSLEQQTKDQLILDGNGLDRFKNGIFTDLFEDFSKANVASPEYSAAVDTSYKELTPRFKQFNVDLKVHATSSTTNYDDKAVLLDKDATDKTVIDQPFATNIRNCVTDFYSFTGKAFIFPEIDNNYDVIQAPDLTLDLSGEAILGPDVVNRFQELLDLSSVSSEQVTRELLGSSSVRFWEWGNDGGDIPNSQVLVERATTSTLVTTTTKTTDFQLTQSEANIQTVGDFVTDLQFLPFMAERDIRVLVHGLRPNTRFYFYFDGVDVNSNVAPASVTRSDPTNLALFNRSGAFGAAITSDANGIVRAIFKLPAGTFKVGDRKLEIMDVSAYNQSPSAISTASAVYTAYNNSVEKQNLAVSTRPFQIDETTSTSRTTRVDQTTSSRIVRIEIPEDDTGNGDDPIAQSFFIRKAMASSDNVIFATKFDLFFEQKSDTAGFTFYIRRVINGAITTQTVPFSKVHVEQADVNVTSTAQAAAGTAAAATTVTFPVPIALKTGEEYAFVVKPDGNSPDYRIWIARTGETDSFTSVKITQDVNEGTLFTSTNDRTWTPYQDENIKYTLYRANFSASTGYVQLTNKDSEFFSIESVTGTFQNDELVFREDANTAGTLSVTAGSNDITGSGTSFGGAGLTNGDWIAIHNGSGGYEVVQIDNVVNSTSMTTVQDITFTDGSAEFFPTVVGRATLFDTTTPARLYLDDSSASSGDVFSATDIVIGSTSGAQATITSVDEVKLSFFRPSIDRSNTIQTKTNMKSSKLSLTGGTEATGLSSVPFNSYSFLSTQPVYIRSRSLEVTSGGKSFHLQIDMENSSNDSQKYSSPMIDIESAALTGFGYIINNDASNEDGTQGSADSKYISRTITLANGLDAEDLKVYLTAYNPNCLALDAQAIKVYGKFQNSGDSVPFDEKAWTELTIETDIKSQDVNRFDFKELEFRLPTTNAGQLASFDPDGVSGQEFSYTDADGVTYNTFKYFAIKVVLLADSHNKVPRLSNLRAIALTA